MRYEELDAKLRARVDAAIGKPAARARSRATAAGPFSPMRCEGVNGCGAVITSEAELNRHHGGRFAVILGDDAVHAVTSAHPTDGGTA